jgi:hypothetical protein
MEPDGAVTGPARDTFQQPTRSNRRQRELMSEDIDALLAERAIQRVLTTYSRGVDLDRDLARSETYAVAFHRYTDADGHPTDMWAGLRYVDRFERRQGEWRIEERVCPRSQDDIVYRILDGPRG